MSKGNAWMITACVLLLLGITSTRAGINLSDSANCFSLKFYKILASKANGNMISSPFSLDVVMSMLLAGAGGATADELRKALEFGQTPMSDILDAFKSNLEQLNQGDGTNTLTTADSVWIQQDFSVKPSYLQIVQQDFYSEVKSVDFGGNSHGATQEINDWGSTKTKGLIPKIFDSDLDPTTVMVLVNAIYFKGTWKYMFDSTMTTESTFYTEDSSNPKVPQMNLLNEMRYQKVPNAEILELDYVGDEISMQLILPSEGIKIADYENFLSCSEIGVILSPAPPSRVNLTMPKFKISSGFDLIPPLKQSGINSIFGPFANLSGINATAPLYVSKVVQKAVTEVNEDGSKAAVVSAAATQLSCRRRSCVGESAEVIPFVANRPFLFLVRHKPTNLVLFMGRVLKF